MIPKLNFEVAPLKHYLRYIHFFLNPEEGAWDWGNSLLRQYPLLGEKLKDVKDREKRIEITSCFFEETEKNEMHKMQEQKEKFQKIWDKINDRALESLSDVAEVEWGKGDTNIKGFVTLNTYCPRDLKRRNFDVFYGFDNKYMKKVCFHEIFHFIYFEKWKEVFPKISEKKFKMPNLVWVLSEMAPGIALKDYRIQDVFGHEPATYGIFKTAIIKGKPLLGYIQKFYDKKRDFADFLRKSWVFTQENEKEIKQLFYRKG